MARTTRTQTTTRAGSGESNVNLPADPVTSYAPYVSYANISADRSRGRSELIVGEALAGFGKTVGQIAVQQREADAKMRRLRGQADALKSGPPADWAVAREAILSDPDKGEEYLKAYTLQGAKVAAASKALDLEDQLAARTDIDTTEAFNQWMTENTVSDIDAIAQLNDPETTIAYAGKLEETELRLRSVVKERAAAKVYNETEANYNMVLQEEFNSLVGRGGATGREMLDLLTRYSGEGRDLLLKSSDINEAQIRAVGQYAESEGRPELLNLFDYPRADAKDPSKSIPGLSFTKEHGALIDSYRTKANAEHDARVSEQLKKTQFEAQKRMETLMADGNTAQAEAFNDLMADQGVFSPAVAMGYYKSIYKQDEKTVRVNRNLNHITLGRTEAIPATERKEAITAYGDRMKKKAEAMGTPEAAHEALKDILTTGASVGVMYPPYAERLKTLNLNDPEQFASTVQLAGVVQAMAPTLYVDNVPKESRMQIDRAVRLLELGHNDADVMGIMQQLRTPEAQARRAEVEGNKTQQAKRRVGLMSNLDLDADHINREEVANWVTESALDYMVYTGEDNYNDALDFAKSEYEANFASVNLAGGMGKVSIYKGKLGLPDTIEEQFQWFSDSFTEEMRAANPGMDSNTTFYLVPDATTRHADEREFIVRDSVGRTQMVMEDGIAVPRRIGQRQLERDWRLDMAKSAEEEQALKQAERLRRDSRAMRNRKYYGIDGDELRRRYRAIGQSPEGEPDVTPGKPAAPVDPMSELPPALQEATNIVARWEGFKGEAYAATDAERDRGIWTIGYGQTVGVKPGQKVTEAEAKGALVEQVQETYDAVASAVGPYWNKLTDGQQAVVVSLAYNIDKDVVGQFKRSKALRALQRGDLETFKHEAFDPKVGFTKQTQKDGTKKVVKGLVNRRKDELAKFEAAAQEAVARR